jgi:KDO2-lipid IV(A) lauroyltransferase
VLGLTVDQRTPAERGGVLVDFLGVPAWTTTAPARLALRTGAAVVPVRAERRADGRHAVFVEPEIDFQDLDGEEGVVVLTERINAAVGEWVRRRPEQFMWLHRRFYGQVKPSLESTEARS